MFQSHREAEGLHWTKSNIVVTVAQTVVVTMQNQSSAMCLLEMTTRSRNTATEDFEATTPIVQLAWPIASHMIALE
jgi:hypothetical protein